MKDGMKFVKKFKKFLESKYIENAAWQYEWKYDENQNEYGIHVHSLLWGDVKYINQHINRQKEDYFHMNAKQRRCLYTDEEIQDKWDYMNGHTFDAKKNEEKLLDQVTRINHYKSGYGLGCPYIPSHTCDPATLGIVVKEVNPEDKEKAEKLAEMRKNKIIVTFD